MDAHVHMYASIQLDFSPVKYCHFLAHRFFHLKSIILAMPCPPCLYQGIKVEAVVIANI